MKCTSIPKIIIACAGLHNISKELGDANFLEDAEGEEQYFRHIEDENGDVIRAQGQGRREEMVHLMNEGQYVVRISLDFM